MATITKKPAARTATAKATTRNVTMISTKSGIYKAKPKTVVIATRNATSTKTAISGKKSKARACRMAPETDPDILRANRYFVRALKSIRENQGR
jgi:hypothetical protein